MRYWKQEFTALDLAWHLDSVWLNLEEMTYDYCIIEAIHDLYKARCWSVYCSCLLVRCFPSLDSRGLNMLVTVFIVEDEIPN